VATITYVIDVVDGGAVAVFESPAAQADELAALLDGLDDDQES
jgi:hypothetical protein